MTVRLSIRRLRQRGGGGEGRSRSLAGRSCVSAYEVAARASGRIQSGIVRYRKDVSYLARVGSTSDRERSLVGGNFCGIILRDAKASDSRDNAFRSDRLPLLAVQKPRAAAARAVARGSNNSNAFGKSRYTTNDERSIRLLLP
jgi:hypothetical protein